MGERIWDCSDNDSIKYVSLTQDTLNQALQIFHESFFVDEYLCKALKLSEHPEAIAELDQLLINIAKDGISIVAKQVADGRVIGACFNKLKTKKEHHAKYYEKLMTNCKHPLAKAFIEMVDDTNAAANLFELVNAECVLDLWGISISKNFRDQDIAKKLVESTFKAGRALKSGDNVKVPLDGKPLKNDVVPTVGCSVCTSAATQAIARCYGLKTAFELSYNEVMFEGRSLASIMGLDVTEGQISKNRMKNRLHKLYEYSILKI